MDTAHVDTFARDHLPPRAQWPDLLFDLPEAAFAKQAIDAVAKGGLGADEHLAAHQQVRHAVRPGPDGPGGSRRRAREMRHRACF